jgi:Sec23/Sec24 trunk domain
VGIATFDSAVQFYALRPGQSAPQMLVVPDILDPYAPSASSLLVNAREARGLVSIGGMLILKLSGVKGIRSLVFILF